MLHSYSFAEANHLVALLTRTRARAHRGLPNYGGNITIPDYPEALVYSFTVDNTAPLNYTQVIQFYRDVQAQYPNAELAATSLGT